jgi:hypothetical protein
MAQGNGLDLSKLTQEQLVAMVNSLQTQAATSGSRKPTFTASKKNADYMTFTHQLGVKGVYPWVTAPKSVWKMIIANIKMIEQGLK